MYGLISLIAVAQADIALDDHVDVYRYVFAAGQAAANVEPARIGPLLSDARSSTRGQPCPLYSFVELTLSEEVKHYWE